MFGLVLEDVYGLMGAVADIGLKTTILLGVAIALRMTLIRGAAPAVHRLFWCVTAALIPVVAVTSLAYPGHMLNLLPDRRTMGLYGLRYGTSSTPVTAGEWAPWAAAIWTLGMLCILAVHANAIRTLARLVRIAADSGDAEWLTVQDRKIRLVYIDDIGTPLTWGLLRPVIAMPSSAREWSVHRRSVAIEHELAHIRKYDWAIQVSIIFVAALNWFNPFVWMFAGRFKSDLEKACDASVVRAGVPAHEYAEQLLAIARESAESRATALVTPMARRPDVQSRIRTILSRETRGPRTPLALLAFTLLLGSAMGLGVVDPWKCAPGKCPFATESPSSSKTQ